MKPKYIECDCGSAEHSIRVTFDEEDKLCYIETQLTKQTFFKRVVAAVKYIFGYECKYGHWDCTILGKDQIEALVIELSGFYRRNFTYDSSGKQKITKAIKDISKGKANSAYIGPKKGKNEPKTKRG